MFKLTCASTVLIVCLAGCDRQTAPSSPATESTDVEPESTELESTELESTELEATEPEATEPEATEPEATEPETTEPESTEAAKDASPPKDPCTGLKQKTCEVTMGCAWSKRGTEEKCVEQGR